MTCLASSPLTESQPFSRGPDRVGSGSHSGSQGWPELRAPGKVGMLLVCAASEPKLIGTIGPMSCHPCRTCRHTQGSGVEWPLPPSRGWERWACVLGSSCSSHASGCLCLRLPFPKRGSRRTGRAAPCWQRVSGPRLLPCLRSRTHARPSEPSPSGSGDTPGPTPPWLWCQCSLAQVGKGWFLSGVGLLSGTRHSGLLCVGILCRHAPGCAGDLSPYTP